MPQDPSSLLDIITSAKLNTSQKRSSQKGQGRKFFQHMQPTFAIAVPRAAIKLEFLDENDPAKNTIVRKKAREWVNKNREISNQLCQRTSKCQSAESTFLRRDSGAITTNLDPLQSVGARYLDPFNILPDIGRQYGHIIEYFLSTSCPEEIPCSDDKYAIAPGNSIVQFSRENTVLGNMANSELSFVLWLYATVTIRDGMLGSFNTDEIYWYYNKALKTLQDALKKEIEADYYSDHLLNAMACITATASFSGMFDTAVLHRNAMIKILNIRGHGDVLRGISTAEQWTRKAIQWCEIMVATQLVEIPQVPYFHPYKMVALPENIVTEAESLTAKSFANLPPLSEPLKDIIQLLHQLAACYANRLSLKKIDSYIIQPLYDVEYALLKILSKHKESPCLSDVEVLLAETFQLYFWTGSRTLPPQTRLCDLLISRIIKALLMFVLEKVPEDLECGPVMAKGTQAIDLEALSSATKALHHSRETTNVILWSLALGTMVSAVLKKPEHWWLKGHFLLIAKAMGLDQNEAEYLAVLELFPTTIGFQWIDLRSLYVDLSVLNITIPESVSPASSD